jgi:acetoin utilization protein AcuB
MHKKNIRRLPVVSEENVVGIISEKDLNFLLAKSRLSDKKICEDFDENAPVSSVMITEVISINQEATIEDAAKKMYIYRVGALPVTDNGRLVGIITESDIFKIFMHIMGISEDCPRLTIEMKDYPGRLYEITKTIKDYNSDIRSIVTFPDLDSNTGAVVIRLCTDRLDEIIEVLKQKSFKVIN